MKRDREPKISANGRITYFLDSDPHVVYRAFAEDGSLLYIGLTCDLKGRMRWHRRYAEWMPRMARLTEEWHPNRAAAAGAEREAIWAERPECNQARY